MKTESKGGRISRKGSVLPSELHMAKTLGKIKSGLKLRTQSVEGALSIKIGTKRYELPFETRLIRSEDHVFVHIPPTAEILKIEGKTVAIVTDVSEAETAVAGFRKRRKRATAAKAPAVIPGEIRDLLQKIPAGYKIAYGSDGQPKVVRSRRRRK